MGAVPIPRFHPLHPRRSRALTQAWYNIVVIGTDLAGLMYASLAARLGYRVVVVGHGALPNAYQHDGFVFLRQAERFYGFATSPVVGKVFSELSLHIEMKNRPQPVDPTVQVVMPGARLDVMGHRRRWERELARELPGMLPAFDAFDSWAKDAARDSDVAFEADAIYPAGGVRARAAYRRVASELGLLVDGPSGLGELDRSPAARATVMGPLSHLSGLLTDPLTPLCTARIWTHLRAGLHRIPGGLDGLKAIFIRKIREQCGDYRPEAHVEQLVIKRGKVSAVILADRGEELGCELVVGNIEPRRFFGLVPRDQRHDGYHAQLAGLQPAGWRFTLNLGVDPRVVPDGMGPELVLIGDLDKRLRGSNSLWISRPGAGPHTGAEGQPGPGALQVTALLESRGAAPTLGGARRLIDESLDRVREVIPWLDQHLKTVHAPALVVDPLTQKPGLDAAQLAPVMGRAMPHTLGTTAFSAQTAYKNILLCGDLLFAGLGFEGICLAALQALTLTQRGLRLKTALRPDRHLN